MSVLLRTVELNRGKLVSIAREHNDIRHRMERIEKSGLLGRKCDPAVDEGFVCPEIGEGDRADDEFECRGAVNATEPVVQSGELFVAEHGARGDGLCCNVGAVATGVHDEEGGVTVAEVVVVLTLFDGLKVGLGVVNFESI